MSLVNKLGTKEGCAIWEGEIMNKEELTASEALFGFVSWLTTRKEVVSMGSNHDCAKPCELVSDYIKANHLKDVTERYPDNLITPEER